MTRTDTSARHLLLYDGVCGMCNRLVSFVLPRDPAGRFRFAALQSDLGKDELQRYGQDPEKWSTFFVVENYHSPSARLIGGARAALFVAGQLDSPWRYLSILGFLPDVVLDWAYALVARHRYRIFGKVDRCDMATGSYKDRFVDL